MSARLYIVLCLTAALSLSLIVSMRVFKDAEVDRAISALAAGIVMFIIPYSIALWVAIVAVLAIRLSAVQLCC